MKILLIGLLLMSCSYSPKLNPPVDRSPEENHKNHVPLFKANTCIAIGGFAGIKIEKVIDDIYHLRIAKGLTEEFTTIETIYRFDKSAKQDGYEIWDCKRMGL